LPNVTPSAVGDTSGLLARGAYLVRYVANCAGCHGADPKNPEGPLSGGHEFKNWRIGTVRAANITPDPATGIGAWSEAEIMRALRNGEDRAGHVLAPVMPYEWFNGMTTRDALAIARYLKSQAPVHNIVKNNKNLIYRLGELFFLGPKKDNREAAASHGEYLALHVALCADCHTPRGGLQNTAIWDMLFAGNAKPPKDWPANPANITPDTATGIGEWSEGDFLKTIRTGTDPDEEKLHDFMPWKRFRNMTEQDLLAIYHYLKTVKPIRNEVPHRHEGMEGHNQ
jgi:mono/diheme cytochrome c family protein